MAEIKCKKCGAICDVNIHDGRCLECDEPFCSSQSAGSVHTIERAPHAMGPKRRINRPNRWGDKDTIAYAWKQVDAQMIVNALNAQNATGERSLPAGEKL